MNDNLKKQIHDLALDAANHNKSLVTSSGSFVGKHAYDWLLETAEHDVQFLFKGDENAYIEDTKKRFYDNEYLGEKIYGRDAVMTYSGLTGFFEFSARVEYECKCTSRYWSHENIGVLHSMLQHLSDNLRDCLRIIEKVCETGVPENFAVLLKDETPKYLPDSNDISKLISALAINAETMGQTYDPAAKEKVEQLKAELFKCIQILQNPKRQQSIKQ